MATKAPASTRQTIPGVRVIESSRLAWVNDYYEDRVTVFTSSDDNVEIVPDDQTAVFDKEGLRQFIELLRRFLEDEQLGDK